MKARTRIHDRRTDVPLDVTLPRTRRGPEDGPPSLPSLGVHRADSLPRKGYSRAGYAAFRREGTSRSRRVSVKVRFVKSEGEKGRANLEKHLYYLSREGTGQDGKRPELFTENGATSLSSAREKISPWAEDRHNWRLIVSPEDSKELDLEAYTKDLIHRIERDLGTKLEYITACHYNTDTPHVHLLIRGKRQDERDLVIPPWYIKSGFRKAAEELSTELLGERTDREIRQAIEREINAERLTSLDRTLLRLAAKTAKSGASLTLPELPAADQKDLKLRLEKLSALDLATKENDGGFTLHKELEGVLRTLGTRNDRIKVMQERYRGRKISGYEIFQRGEVTGRISYVGIEDELYDKEFLILDSVDGRAFYIPVPSLRSSDLKEGQFISVKDSERGLMLTKADQEIQRIANQNAGGYTTALHLKDLTEVGPKVPKGRPEETVKRFHSRLETLLRYRLIHKTESGFQIPEDLEARLQGTKRSANEVSVLDLRPLKKQVNAQDLTFLDLQLQRRISEGQRAAPRSEFEEALGTSLKERLRFLETIGLAKRTEGKLMPDVKFIDVLREKSLGKDVRFVSLLENERLEGELKKRTSILGRPYLVFKSGEQTVALLEEPQMRSIREGDTVKLKRGRDRIYFDVIDRANKRSL